MFQGWRVNGLTVMRTGLSVNVTCGCDSMRIGAATARPDRLPVDPLRPATVDIPNNQINIGAFRAPAPGTWGNVGRNILKGPAAPCVR